MNTFKTLSSIPESHLCCGCGVCAYLYPEDIKMQDVASSGRRPAFIRKDKSGDIYPKALTVCPGIHVAHLPEILRQKGLLAPLVKSWGPVFELWEGYAADQEIRFEGSSGGVMSALALYCLEKENVAGVLHVAADEGNPHLNKTIFSETKESILSATGSRYSPASPCEQLKEIDNANAPCVFMGKPCDVAAVKRLTDTQTGWSEKIALSIACFCAGTPSTNGTLEILAEMGLEDTATLLSLRYRGCGWPGKPRVELKHGRNSKKKVLELDYHESWGGILQKHRQWRCYICPDHTGEFADISVGDPWYRDATEDDPGRSLILIRTEKGRAVLQKAIASGYLIAERRNEEVLPASQVNLEKARARLWGQLIALKLCRAPCPRYGGFSLYQCWRQNLNFTEKVRSILGTVKRVFVKKLREKPRTSL